MNHSFSIQHLTETGHELMLTKYFSGAITAFLLYEYLLTLPDEIRYVWGGRKNWIFYLFLYNRYTPIVFKSCTLLCKASRVLLRGGKSLIVPALYYSGYTRERRVLVQPSGLQFTDFLVWLRCNRTAFLALIFIVMSTLVTQILLTLRLYALSQRSKLALAFCSTLSLAQLTFGIVMISSPSNSGMKFPELPLDAFRLCVVKTKTIYEIVYAGLSFVFDIATFATIVYYAIRSKSQYGMPHIIKTVLEDTAMYSFIMALCHLMLILFVILAKTPIKLLPATGSVIFLPVLTTRLVLSLKKAADTEPGGEWRVERFGARTEPPSPSHFRSLSFELQPTATRSVNFRGQD